MTLSEEALIETYFRPLAGDGALDLRDDAACLQLPEDSELIVTQDALVAGVHFFAHDPPDHIGRKALRVNLSDLAAKGAQPLGFFLTLALPPPPSPSWLEAFSTGLREDIHTYHCPLLGGDTVRMPGPLTLSITALGLVPKGSMRRRDRACPGDFIYVTGTIGDAALGLRLLLPTPSPTLLSLPKDAQTYLYERYQLPHPRLSLAPSLRIYARAAMDLSDGLLADLTKFVRASRVGASISLAHIPYSTAAQQVLQQGPLWRDLLLTGGDDYELLLSVPPACEGLLCAHAAQEGIVCTKIGLITEGTEPIFYDSDGNSVIISSCTFSHFD